MSIRTKLKINLYTFMIIAMVLISNEAQMRLTDEVRAFLALPIFGGIA